MSPMSVCTPRDILAQAFANDKPLAPGIPWLILGDAARHGIIGHVNGERSGRSTQARQQARGEHRQRSAFVIGPLLLFSVLSVLLTWPLAAQFVTHVPGDGIDDPSLAWNLWWIKQALVDRPQNPFQVAWQFWPVGINLAFYTLTLLNGMLALPLQMVFGLIPAYNLILLSSFALGGLGAYLLCLDFLARGAENGRRPAVVFAGFLGGVLYAFASAKLFYAALGQGNIASSQWIPFALLYIVRATRPRGRPREAALAALFIVLQAYAELTYASFLALFAALAAFWRVAAGLRGAATRATEISGLASGRRCRAAWAGLAGRLLLLATCSVIGLGPVLMNMVPDLQAEGDFFTSGGGFADIFAADLAGYALPTQLHPLLGNLIRRVANDSAPRPDGSHFPVNKGQHIYLGYTALALIAVGLWHGRRRPQTWFWALAGGGFFLLTLGPRLRVAGHDLGLPLPFELIASLPFFKGNRYPSRYSVMLLASCAPLLAAGAVRLSHLACRVPRSTLDASRLTCHASRFMLLALLLFEHLSAPLPLSDLRVPALYGQVAAVEGDFALLELPPGWRNGARVAGKQDIVIMRQLWNQTAHGKRLLGGNTSRNPEFKFQFFSEDPTLARLIAETNAADLPQHDALRAYLASHPVSADDAARARAWAATWAVRYVMVHRDKVPAATEAALHRLLPATPVAEEGDLALFRVAADLQPPDFFPVGSDGGRMILAEGWSPPGFGEAVYAQRGEARLLLPLGPEARQVRLEMWALAPDQQVTLVVDGQPVGTAPLPARRGWLAFDLPRTATRPPLSDVRLRFSALVPTTRVAASLSLVVRSAGQETGDFAHVYVNGVDRAANQRGYNLVALDPASGHVLATAVFDTHADETADQRLAAWVNALPAGVLVAVAVRDEASFRLRQAGVDALRILGARTDLRGHFRWGHVLIGTKGAAVGAVPEEASGWRVAQAAIGLPVTAPQVAAALVGVQIVK